MISPRLLSLSQIQNSSESVINYWVENFISYPPLDYSSVQDSSLECKLCRIKSSESHSFHSHHHSGSTLKRKSTWFVGATSPLCFIQIINKVNEVNQNKIKNKIKLREAFIKKRCNICYTFFGGGQDRSSLHFSNTCLKCVSSHSQSFKTHLLWGWK